MDFTLVPAPSNWLGESSADTAAVQEAALQEVSIPQSPQILSYHDWLSAAGYIDGPSANGPYYATCPGWMGHQSRQQQQRQQRPQLSQQDVEDLALDYMRYAIECLDFNPHIFNDIAKYFHVLFDGLENNMYVLSNAMEDIFKDSLIKEHFRPSGVKLYHFLYKLNPHPDSLFHTLIKCKLEDHRTEVDQYVSIRLWEMVRETAFLLSELFKQLRTDGSRIHIFSEHIVYALKHLVAPRRCRSDHDLRCICRTLKLVGDDLTVDCAAEMQQIIRQLGEIRRATTPCYQLVIEVIRMHREDWSRSIPASQLLEPVPISKEPEVPLLEPKDLDFPWNGPPEDLTEFLRNLETEMEKESQSEKVPDLKTTKKKNRNKNHWRNRKNKKMEKENIEKKRIENEKVEKEKVEKEKKENDLLKEKQIDESKQKKQVQNINASKRKNQKFKKYKDKKEMNINNNVTEKKVVEQVIETNGIKEVKEIEVVKTAEVKKMAEVKEAIKEEIIEVKSTAEVKQVIQKDTIEVKKLAEVKEVIKDKTEKIKDANVKKELDESKKVEQINEVADVKMVKKLKKKKKLKKAIITTAELDMILKKAAENKLKMEKNKKLRQPQPQPTDIYPNSFSSRLFVQTVNAALGLFLSFF